MNELALFTGAGGGILGTRLLGWRVVCGVEINPYYREVLLRRQEEGIIEPFPLWDDIGTFDGTAWRGKVDIITAGFPCQGYSVAGKQLGEHDERNLWPDTIRIIREVEPKYCLLENVPNLLTFGYFGTILRDLSKSGYDARWKVISAAEVGAPHLRNRIWIVANTNGTGRQQECPSSSGNESKDERWSTLPDNQSSSSSKEMANAKDRESDGWNKRAFRPSSSCWWAVEPELGRVAHGVAYRVDRLKALGEGQVPGVVRAAWELLR